MKITMKNGKEMEIREAVENKVGYISHYDLKMLAANDGTMFPHVSTANTGTFSSVMCVVSGMDGKRSYGTGQAQTLKWAADMAFDNAMIDLYQIKGKSSVDLEILKKMKADQERKAAEEKAAKAAEEKAAKEAAAEKAAEEKAARKAVAKKAAEEKAAREAAAKKAAEEKAAREAAAKKAAEEKAAREAAAKKAAEEKAAREAAAKKAAEEDAARRAAQESASKDSVPAAGGTGYWYENEPDWAGCHSLTPEDPDDAVINYGPFKQTTQPSELKPGPKYLSQVLKYRADFVEKLIGIQPVKFMEKIPQILTYCSRHGIGLHAANGKARDMLQKYNVKELD